MGSPPLPPRHLYPSGFRSSSSSEVDQLSRSHDIRDVRAMARPQPPRRSRKKPPLRRAEPWVEWPGRFVQRGFVEIWNWCMVFWNLFLLYILGDMVDFFVVTWCIYCKHVRLMWLRCHWCWQTLVASLVDLGGWSCFKHPKSVGYNHWCYNQWVSLQLGVNIQNVGDTRRCFVPTLD